MICVTFDPITNQMSASLSTTVDEYNSTITCTFTQNNSLFYDSHCTIIDQ